MVRLAKSGGGVLLLLLGVFLGCDSTDPDQDESQILGIQIRGSALVGANEPLSTFNVWRIFVDNDEDNVPDDGKSYLWCEALRSSQLGTSGDLINSPLVPWGFAVKVSVIRAGETEPELLTSETAFSDPDSNLTLYDDSEPASGISGILPRVAGTTVVESRFFLGSSRWVFRRYRGEASETGVVILPATHVNVMFAPANPLAAAVGGGLGTGLCNTGNPGPSTFDGQDHPATFELGKGDSIFVEVRVSDSNPTGVTLRTTGTLPNLTAAVTRDGIPIGDLKGTTSTNADPQGTGSSFTYTAR